MFAFSYLSLSIDAHEVTGQFLAPYRFSFDAKSLYTVKFRATVTALEGSDFMKLSRITIKSRVCQQIRLPEYGTSKERTKEETSDIIKLRENVNKNHN